MHVIDQTQPVNLLFRLHLVTFWTHVSSNKCNDLKQGDTVRSGVC